MTCTHAFCMVYRVFHHQFLYLVSYMKKLLIILWISIFSTISVFASASGCVYTGNPLESFKNCSPTGVIEAENKAGLDVTDPKWGFMTLVQKAVKLIQTSAFYIGVGIIVWLGILMVIPWNGEAKEATKSKLISVLIGFLVMLSATIIINAIINIIYEIFS